MTLQAEIQSLADAFTESLLRALREATLEDILAETGRGAPSRGTRAAAAPASASATRSRGRGKRLRRSGKQLESTIGAIMGVLKGSKEGMRSEELQAALGVDKKVLVRPIALALADKKIKKTGEKRATRYFVV